MADNYNDFLNTIDSEWFKPRLNRVVYAVLVAFAILFVRLFYLQILVGEEMRHLSESNSIRLQSIDPYRGLIYDRNGYLLVDNRPSFNISIVPKDARPLERTVKTFAESVGVPASELMAKIVRGSSGRPYRPVVMLRDIDRDLLASVEVRKYDLPGIRVDVKPQRHYLQAGGGSAHLIGYLGEVSMKDLQSGKGYRGGDMIGRFGVEKAYEAYLRGERGGRQVEVDVTGRVMRVLNTVPARPGDSIYLTIDHVLQQRAEALLDGRAGALVAVVPDTGEILALVSSPSFDQNIFVNGMSRRQWQALISNPLRPLENKAIQGEYPPGSTYKIVTAIAALEEGIVDENTTFHCPGHFRFGDRVFRCWNRAGHGKVSLVDAIAESCDVYFYNVAQKLGVDRLAWYARACGLGDPTGIDLDHEESGLVPSKAWKRRRYGTSWQAGETLSVAIGQGYNLATPLQMAMLVSAVANGGTRFRPLILKEVVAGGTVKMTAVPEPVGQLPASPHTLELVKQGLFKAVNHRRGTAWRIRSAEIGIAGKTGTAQIVSRKKGEAGDDKDRAYHLTPHAWFVGYGPADSPKIAIAVIVEHGEHGSSTAAPIVGELIELYLSREKSGTLKADADDPARKTEG